MRLGRAEFGNDYPPLTVISYFLEVAEPQSFLWAYAPLSRRLGLALGRPIRSLYLQKPSTGDSVIRVPLSFRRLEILDRSKDRQGGSGERHGGILNSKKE